VYHHRYHLVWITKYRYRLLQGQLRMRVREIIAQVAEEIGIKIVNGVLSSDHIHIIVSIPPHISVSEFVKVGKGRSTQKIQQEFLEMHKKHWGALQDTYLGICSDDQLENRFEPLILPRWEYGEEYLRLLVSYIKMLPLR
jgi:REP element-mobilizing transposase RayT